jgi:hypothetical protein
MDNNLKRFDKKTIDKAIYYTISAAVWSVLEDMQAGAERFNQFLKFAIDGARMFNFDMLHEVKSVEIEMEPWKQICFPGDMVDWHKIGFRYGDGVMVFVNDSTVPKLFDKNDDCEPQPHKYPDGAVPDGTTIGEAIVFDSYMDGDHYYGVQASVNYAGYFDVDERNRVFNFKRTITSQTQVYLEYITDGINYSGQTVIHPYAFRALQLYIHWQRKEYDDRFGLGERERAQRIFEREFDDAMVRNLNMSIEDVHDALLAGYKQTIKN